MMVVRTPARTSFLPRVRQAINDFPVKVARGEVSDRQLEIGWVLTRLWGMAALFSVFPYDHGWPVDVDVVGAYYDWSVKLWAGAVPYRGFFPLYPPGIIPFLALPPYSVGAYKAEFLLLAFAADALIMNLLLRSRRVRGASMWIAAGVLLGPIIWTRLDIFVAAALVGALVSVERGRYRLAGLLIGFAALIKVWPVLLVLVWLRAVPSGRRLRLVGATALTVVAGTVPVLAAAGGVQGMWDVLQAQAGRGIELESLFALPLYVIANLGHYVPVVLSVSFEFAGHAAGVVSDVASVAFISAIAACLWKAGRNRPPMPSLSGWMLLLAAVLIVTAKVLSPQYWTWVVACAALYVDSIPRRKALVWTVALALVMTQVLFPFGLMDLIYRPGVGLAFSALHVAVVSAFLVATLRAVLRPGAPVPADSDQLVGVMRTTAKYPFDRMPA